MLGPRLALALLMVAAGAAPASADCFSARNALASAQYGVDSAVQGETAASERYIVAHSEAEASRLRLEREQRRERSASRERSETGSLCRYLYDDRGAIRACEDSAAAAYDRARNARRYAADAARYAEAAARRARSALRDSERAVSRAENVLRDARRGVRRECRP